MTPVAKALSLATLNVFLIAYALSVEVGARIGSAIVLVVIFSIIPALLLGALLGRIAEATAAHRPLWRLAVLALPASGLVITLASAFEMLQFAPYACIPTFVAASILERTTRQPQSVPVAVVE
jgi:uncharacterized membrane protein